MNGFTYIIYFLLVILFLLCFHFLRKETRILEGKDNISTGGSLGITVDNTKFGKYVDQLIQKHKDLETSLDKINNTYGELKTQEDIRDGIKTTMDELSVIRSNKQKDIDNEYLLIGKKVQPIMFLRLNDNIMNDITSIDVNIKNILDTTPYKEINIYGSNLISKYGKKCLYLPGINRQGVDFGTIPTLKQITFSFWIYNDNVPNVDAVISVMNSTDFNNNVANSGLKVYINKIPNKVEVFYNGNTLKHTIHDGWNHITFTSGVTNACIYIDGDIINNKCGNKVDYIQPQINSYETKYRLKTYFIIGRTTFKGYIYNVRYYAIEIPARAITNVYKVDLETKSSNA